MSDRIAVMNHGRFEQVDVPERVYEHPRTTFVAGFIGVSNLMPATVRRGGAHGSVALDAGAEIEADASEFTVGGRCYAVVRPEKLRIVQRGDPAEGLATVEGLVESSVYLGTATQIVVNLGDGVRMTVLIPNADEAERGRLPGGGATVKLGWAPQHMHLVRDSSSSSEEFEQATQAGASPANQPQEDRVHAS